MTKRIIITGANSYIGSHIASWINQKEPDWEVQMLSVRDPNTWGSFDYSNVDVVVHVAGLVHHPEITDWESYQHLNVDMTTEISEKAKRDGVSQFIYFSTMGVYGKGKKLCPNLIDEKTSPVPGDPYSKSKLLAEQALKELQDKSFSVAIIRPPNVYGKGCKGRYISGFASIVKLFPFIPKAYENVYQSMIYIDNLCELTKEIIRIGASGIFEPQDERAVNSVELMLGISKGLRLKRKPSSLLGTIVYLLSWLPIVKKAYGGVAYSEQLSSLLCHLMREFVEL